MATEAQIVAKLQSNGTLIRFSQWDGFEGFPPPNPTGWINDNSDPDTKILAGRGVNGSSGLRSGINRIANPEAVSPGGINFQSDPLPAAVADGPIFCRKYIKFLGPNEGVSPGYRFYCRRDNGGLGQVTTTNNNELQKCWYVPWGSTAWRVLLGVQALGPNVTGEDFQNDLEGIFGFDYADHRVQTYNVIQSHPSSTQPPTRPATEPDVLFRIQGGKWYCVEIMVHFNIGGNINANMVRVWVNGIRILSRQNYNDPVYVAAGAPPIGGDTTRIADTYGGQGGDPFNVNPPTDLFTWRDNVIMAREYVGPADDIEPQDIWGRSSKYIWISPTEIASLPASGTYWDDVLTDAGLSTINPSLQNKTENKDVYTLAKALVYQKTQTAIYRTQGIASLLQAILTLEDNEDGQTSSRSLAPGRNLVSYIIAAQLLDLSIDDELTFQNWLRTATTTVFDDGRTIRSTQRDRPNNWGTMAGASRIARNLYLLDTVELADSVAVFKGYLGDRAQYAGFNYGPLCWQSDQALPVGINPFGATISGANVDGVLPDDQRRWFNPDDETSCVFQSNPFPTTNYVYEALQGVIVAASLLFRAGYTDVFSWSDAAILRAYRWLNEQAFYPAAGDDLFQLPLVDFHNSITTYWPDAGSPAVGNGKNGGYTSWTHGVRIDYSGRGSGEPPPGEPQATRLLPTQNYVTLVFRR